MGTLRAYVELYISGIILGRNFSSTAGEIWQKSLQGAFFIPYVEVKADCKSDEETPIRQSTSSKEHPRAPITVLYYYYAALIGCEDHVAKPPDSMIAAWKRGSSL